MTQEKASCTLITYEALYFLIQTDYGAFLRDDRYAKFDPRPSGSETTKEEVDWFINR